MRRSLRPVRQDRGPVTLGGVQLRLGQEQAVREPRPAQVGGPEVGTEQIGAGQIGIAQIRADQVGPAQARATQICLAQARAHQVRTPAIRSVVAGSHVIGHRAEQRADVPPMALDVECEQVLGTLLGESPSACRASWSWDRRSPSVRASASSRYQSDSCSCRITVNDPNIAGAILGALRQFCPLKVTPVTCWPAPKQSKTVHPGKPRSRRPEWMPQRKSVRRFVHGVPAGLSIAKSADAVNAGATQQSPAHAPQSAFSS